MGASWMRAIDWFYLIGSGIMVVMLIGFWAAGVITFRMDLKRSKREAEKFNEEMLDILNKQQRLWQQYQDEQLKSMHHGEWFALSDEALTQAIGFLSEKHALDIKQGEGAGGVGGVKGEVNSEQ